MKGGKTMKTYTSPEVFEIAVADEVILGAKDGPLWDEVSQAFLMNSFSVLDLDE
jgi:hypothetical protein